MSSPASGGPWTPTPESESDGGWGEVRHSAVRGQNSGGSLTRDESGRRAVPTAQPGALTRPGGQPVPHTAERGLPGWQAVIVLMLIAGVGGVIDLVSGNSVRGGFNIGLSVASLVAILLVRRSRMFSVVVAPPLVYVAFSAALLYIRTDGLNNRGALLDGAVNFLVYGFPALAIATAIVLVVAGVRMVRGTR